MRTRKTYLLKADAFTAARTKTQDINVADPISSIDIIVKMTNGSAMTEASVVKIHDEFTKIEVVDGADVLVSASMEELQGLNFVELGGPPYMLMTLEDSGVQYEVCHILFGTGKDDPNHYLRPSDFKNLQIKVTNTFTTAAATSWAASGHSLTIIANVIEEGLGAYEGFLTTKSMYSFDAVDGAQEVIDMPRDYPYRQIMIQAEKTGYGPESSIELIKLSCDADKYVPVDLDFAHLVMDNISEFGPGSIKYAKRMTNAADVLYSDLWKDAWAAGGGGTTLVAVHTLSVDGEKVVLQSYIQT